MEIRYLQSDGHRYWTNIDITVGEWMGMLQDEDIISAAGLDMFQRWYAEPDKEATASAVWRKQCTLGQRHPYNSIVKAVGMKIVHHLDRFEVKQHKDPTRRSYWILMFEGEYVKGKSGSFKWKLRSELALAMERLGLLPDHMDTNMLK